MSDTKLNVSVEELAGFIYSRLCANLPPYHTTQNTRWEAVAEDANRIARRMLAAEALYQELHRIIDLGEHHFTDNNGWRPVLTVNMWERSTTALALADGKEAQP